MPDLAGLPDRSPEARGRLLATARAVAPVSAAGERRIEVAGPLGALLPEHGLRRGTVTRVSGAPGSGATSVVTQLLAAVTAAGEWAAFVDGTGAGAGTGTGGRAGASSGTGVEVGSGPSFGGLAALDAGLVPERFVLVCDVPRHRWATVVGALLEGMTLVASVVPVGAKPGDARRLVARAREQGASLVVVESIGVVASGVGAWPGPTTLDLHATGSTWGTSDGYLGEPTLHVEVTGKGVAPRGRRASLARAG